MRRRLLLVCLLLSSVLCADDVAARSSDKPTAVVADAYASPRQPAAIVECLFTGGATQRSQCLLSAAVTDAYRVEIQVRGDATPENACLVFTSDDLTGAESSDYAAGEFHSATEIGYIIVEPYYTETYVAYSGADNQTIGERVRSAVFDIPAGISFDRIGLIVDGTINATTADVYAAIQIHRAETSGNEFLLSLGVDDEEQ